MKKFIFLMAIVTGCAKISGQVTSPQDHLSTENKILLGKAMQDTYYDITNRYKWFTRVGNAHGVSFQTNISYLAVAPSTKAVESYEQIIGLAIRQAKSYGVDVNRNNELWQFFFLTSPPLTKLKESNIFIWDISDFYEIGVLAVTRLADFAHTRIIIVRENYKPDNKPNLLMNRILHGMGHVLHEESLGIHSYLSHQSNFNGFQPSFTVTNQRRKPMTDPVALYVGDRATYSRSEFVAEMFAYTCMGDEVAKIGLGGRISQLVLHSYRWYLGPAINFQNGR
jgi:hypothetical protein